MKKEKSISSVLAKIEKERIERIIERLKELSPNDIAVICRILNI